jgi:hypothetical protein
MWADGPRVWDIVGNNVGIYGQDIGHLFIAKIYSNKAVEIQVTDLEVWDDPLAEPGTRLELKGVANSRASDVLCSINARTASGGGVARSGGQAETLVWQSISGPGDRNSTLARTRCSSSAAMTRTTKATGFERSSPGARRTGRGRRSAAAAMATSESPHALRIRGFARRALQPSRPASG